MKEMTKKERVIATLNLQETDRVPIYDLLYNDAVIEYFTGKIPPPGEEGLKITCEAISRMLDILNISGKYLTMLEIQLFFLLRQAQGLMNLDMILA